MPDHVASGKGARDIRGFWQKRGDDLAIIETILRNRHHFSSKSATGRGWGKSCEPC